MAGSRYGSKGWTWALAFVWPYAKTTRDDNLAQGPQ